MLRQTLRDFADQELRPIAAKLDKEEIYPKTQVCLQLYKSSTILRDIPVTGHLSDSQLFSVYITFAP